MHFGEIDACASLHWKPKQDKFNKEEHHMRCLSIGHPVKHELCVLHMNEKKRKHTTHNFK